MSLEDIQTGGSTGIHSPTHLIELAEWRRLEIIRLGIENQSLRARLIEAEARANDAIAFPKNVGDP